ncbi:ABC transporter permease [uncultured Paludibaculum sp.]|uniref:ABC transporter permease n=1 Tax=uncultured Paludibaculum sp. TaxID=1765020 RepID=UPI002AAC2B79|nr:ABC transporter permease [uncultured Paludibaculum sp.]
MSAPAIQTLAMPPRRVVRAYAVEAKYESLRMLRAPSFAGPFLLLPAALYLLFAVLLFGPEIAKDPRSALFMYTGFSVLGVMGPGLFGFGISVATEREQGLLKLKRALPMPQAAVLLARMLMSMLFVAIVMASMSAVSPFGGLHLSASQLIAFSLVNVAGAAPFCAMGFFVGSLVSAKAAPAFVNIVYLPMIYLSAILFPLPKSMQWIAVLSPAFHLDQLGLAAMGVASYGSPAVHVIVLAGVTVVFAFFAVRRLARVG